MARLGDPEHKWLLQSAVALTLCYGWLKPLSASLNSISALHCLRTNHAVILLINPAFAGTFGIAIIFCKSLRFSCPEFP
jgi:hypothetical protein